MHKKHRVKRFLLYKLYKWQHTYVIQILQVFGYLDEPCYFPQESQIDMDAPHMDPAVVVVQQSPPHHAHPAAAAPPPPHHPAVTTAMLSNPVGGAPGITTQTFTNQIFMPPTTLAAMQQMHAHAHAQQQVHPADPRPAPGFAGMRPPQPMQPMQPMPPQQPQQPPQQPQVRRGNETQGICN